MTETPFGDLDDFFALPRVSGLAVSPDGSRVVTTVSELNEKRTEYVTAIWELDPKGLAPGRRLTRGAKGESAPAFTSNGDLLFVAVRPTDDDDKPPAALWNLPAAGGEAVEVLAPPGGVEVVKTARDKAAAVVRAPLLPSARSFEDDHRLRDLRKDNKITAILHTGYPIRHWDRDLGPGAPHLLALNLADDATPTDLTPRPAGALRDADFDVSPDGTFVVTSWQRPAPGASQRSVLVRVDLASGEHSVIADEPEADLWSPTVSPDGTAVAFLRESYSTPQHAPRISLRYMRFGETPAELVADWDRWPTSVTFSRDGGALLVTADDGGRCPVFRLDIAAGEIQPLTTDDYAYTEVTAAPDGIVYALRSSYACPPHPVRIDPGGTVTPLPCVEHPRLPGSLTEVRATADDGTSVRSWLVLPDERSARTPCSLGSRGTAEQLELLALAMEPVGARGPRIRGAASGSGALDRLRPGLHPARLGRMGRCAVRGSDGRHRRRVRPSAHRCVPHRRDGRFVRRVHGQLDRRPHRPVRRHRQPRQPVGARPVQLHHRRRLLLAARDDA